MNIIYSLNFNCLFFNFLLADFFMFMVGNRIIIIIMIFGIMKLSILILDTQYNWQCDLFTVMMVVIL